MEERAAEIQPVSISQESQPVRSPVPAKPKNRFFPFLVVVVILLSLGIGGYVAYKNMQPGNQVLQTTPTPSVLLKPTAVDLTVDWKTFTKSDWSFRYPPNLFAKEPVANFVDLVDSEDTPASNARISVDARLIEPYLNDYDTALKRRANDLNITNPQTKILPYGVIISGKLGPGMGEGLKVTNGLVKYKNGAISVEYSGTNVDPQTFDQILSTFKFVDQTTPTPSPPTTTNTCPASEWIDCMPVSDSAGIKYECTSGYLEWAKEHCPNFKGVAN